jgi:hypothetical protein
VHPGAHLAAGLTCISPSQQRGMDGRALNSATGSDPGARLTCRPLEPDLQVGQLRYPGHVLARVGLHHAELAVLQVVQAAARPGSNG